MTTPNSAEDLEYIVDRTARVLAAMDGHLSSYKTHEFYRRETRKRAELMLELMESWGLAVVSA